MPDPTIGRIRDLQDRAYALLKDSAGNKLYDQVDRINSIIQLLVNSDVQYMNVLTQLMESQSALDKIEYRSSEKPKSFHITVTQGMLNQKFLPFTGPVRDGGFSPGQKIEIDFGGSVGVVNSVIQSGTKMLKARGVVGRFYHEQQVKVGDLLKLEPITSNRWSIRRRTPYRR